jgi:hypothetical protein
MHFLIVSVSNDPLWKTQYNACSYIARKGVISQESTKVENEEISLYPNPTNHTVNFQSNNGTVIEHIRMTDIQGREIAKFENVESIDVSTYSSGIYYLELSTGGNTQRKKLQIIK